MGLSGWRANKFRPPHVNFEELSEFFNQGSGQIVIVVN